MNKKLVIIDGLLLSTQKEPYNFSGYEKAESFAFLFKYQSCTH